MKRLLAFTLFLSLLLCGCTPSAPAPTEQTAETAQTHVTTEATEITTETTIEPTTEPTAAPTTEPIQPKPEKVKVYLLEKSVIYDSGFTSYHYDESCNIDSYKVYTIENDLMHTVYFENRDAHGMAAQQRTEWASDGGSSIRLLTYADGRLKEEQEPGDTFTGFQYKYDQMGNLTEKLEYYEGSVYATVRYVYNGSALSSAYCEDQEGKRVYDCRVENNLIVEKAYNDSDGYSIHYEYDDNGNLTQESVVFQGEHTPGVLYYYTEIEVDAQRVPYLLEQQKYLLAIT